VLLVSFAHLLLYAQLLGETVSRSLDRVMVSVDNTFGISLKVPSFLTYLCLWH
jgi:hypothetical protein